MWMCVTQGPPQHVAEWAEDSRRDVPLDAGSG